MLTRFKGRRRRLHAVREPRNRPLPERQVPRAGHQPGPDGAEGEGDLRAGRIH